MLWPKPREATSNQEEAWTRSALGARVWTPASRSRGKFVLRFAGFVAACCGNLRKHVWPSDGKDRRRKKPYIFVILDTGLGCLEKSHPAPDTMSVFRSFMGTGSGTQSNKMAGKPRFEGIRQTPDTRLCPKETG